MNQDSLEIELSDTIRQAAPEVVRQVLVKAKEGSYLHAKFLFELAGIDLTKGYGSERDAEEESLAAYLLRELSEAPRDDAAEGRQAG